MKQYLNSEQTAKLIELGFEKPKNRSEEEVEEILKVIVPFDEFEIPISNNYPAYSIGELISFLPDDGVSNKRLEFDCFHWIVDWDSFDKIHQTMQVELVDALYDMCVKLKEEGVI